MRRYSTAVPRPLPLRGVVEGFYGPPWSRDARLALVEFIAARGMNAYVYAPKSDPRHRERWREPYDEIEGSYFRTLADRARECDVRFGFAISPGLDIDYRAETDRRALIAKLAPLVDAGVDWFVLALDDIPNRPALATDQAALCTWLLDALHRRDPGTRLSLVPTEYVGTRPTPYLRDLAAGLPPGVEDVMWTGPTVCSPTITAADARSWATALGGRRPLLWDNYPVNDGPMEASLHLGAYRGRPAALSDELAGVLCNPMVQPWASRVALATAAEYLRDPEGYDADTAWARAVTDVGGARAPALEAIAAACADGPLDPPEHLEAHRLTRHVLDGDEPSRAVETARQHFGAVKVASRGWSDEPDDPLGAELEPWLVQARQEARAALAALDLLEHVRRPGDAPDADTALLHAFAVIFAWNTARAGNRKVFGPRFGVYPALVQLVDGRAGLDVDLAVVEDRNAVDGLCRHALAAYRTWAGTLG
jgi:hyaluronoglucosaminidase